MTAMPKTTTLRYKVLHALGEEGPSACADLIPEGSDFVKTRACLVNARDCQLVVSVTGETERTIWALTPHGVRYLEAMEEGRPWSTAC